MFAGKMDSSVDSRFQQRPDTRHFTRPRKRIRATSPFVVWPIHEHAVTDSRLQAWVNREAKDLTQQARGVLDTAFEELLRKIQIMGQTIFKDALKLDPLFWWDCQKEWGQGPGYKGRVSTRNETWFTADDRRKLEKELWDVIAREWSTVLSRLSSLLEMDAPTGAPGSREDSPIAARI